MSEEEMMAALNELKESMMELFRLKKHLARITKKGVYFTSYRDIQDKYLNLKQGIVAAKRRLDDWEDLLPEDEEGDPIYPALGEAGYEYSREV